MAETSVSESRPLKAESRQDIFFVSTCPAVFYAFLKDEFVELFSDLPIFPLMTSFASAVQEILHTVW